MPSFTVELHQMEREQVLAIVQELELEVRTNEREIRDTVSDFIGHTTGDYDAPIVFVVI